ncbi:MAG TPA: membrane protein insertase YidC [Pseudonocardiaceae bacterium]|nr:membrane protein insertase YidC [Pseudonocardiaceae bacterium]
MLNFIYYPVSGILWFWHKVFGYVFGPGNGFAWALAVVFLVFTLRAVLFKPFVSQVRSMRKMQEFAPEIQKLKKKYGDDRQKMAVEMQKLQTEHGVNPLGGCLPVLVQIPVFIGLFHVLRSFNRPFLSADANRQIGNYVFSAADVRSFLDAHVFGVPLSAYITEPADLLARYGDISRWHIAAVAIPLTIVAGILTHLTAKHSVARQNPAQIAANPQAAMMNRLMVYLFPLGVVAGGPFFPLAILLYWLSNNLWTLAQQRVVYQWIDAEDEEKKQAAIASRQSLAPRPGQKPSRPRKDAASGPVDLTDSDESDSTTGSAGSAGSGADDASRRSNIDSPDSGGSMAGSADSVAPSTNGQGSARVDRPAPPGMIQQRPRPRKKPNRKRR